MRILSLVLLVACSTSSGSGRPAPASQPSTTGANRTALLAKDDPRFEGPTFKNACGGDADCKTGGCSNEICTAEEGVMSACVVQSDQPRGASCGCVSGECVWYAAAGATPTPTPTPADSGGAPQGMPCADGKCAAGLSCVKYYGIAGPNGPAFTSCEIRCGLSGATKGCPAGQKCITIADGPGQVCRPQQ
jgi:eight-cysteine-cluster-containing protein